MSHNDPHPALQRVMAVDDADTALDLLGSRLSGADLTTFLLEVARRRAAEVDAAGVLRQYEDDRFVAPAPVDALHLARIQYGALAALSPGFEPIALAPLAPFATHATLGAVDQNNVLTTLRRGEVAADPTTALSLEAARRRQKLLDDDPRSPTPVQLTGVSRVARAQVFDGPRSFAHFTLLGVVTAGRDPGNRRFEEASLVAQIRAIGGWLQEQLALRTRVRLTDFSGTHGDLLERVAVTLGSDWLMVEAWPERAAGKGYYPGICFKLLVRTDDDEVEVGDGGFVDWTQMLLENRKERLLISGVGLERIAML